MKRFDSGDVVTIKRDFPYIDHSTMTDDIYIIEKMLDVAGVVTLKNFPKYKTFPVDAFELYKGESI